MPSRHSINRLFVFVDYANKSSPTLKSFLFASARSDYPDFLFKILIEEGQRIRMLLIPGTGNGERGTGNGERGTGNGSLGTSVQRQLAREFKMAVKTKERLEEEQFE